MIQNTKKVVIYIHGKGGSADESRHYEPLFPDYRVFGFDYVSQTPWEARSKFISYLRSMSKEYGPVTVVANSIGAFFVLVVQDEADIERAYLISPVVDMEELICNMLQWSGVTEDELEQKGAIETPFGETLSWEYLTWVRRHPVKWGIPTDILYGERDGMQAIGTIKAFASMSGASVTVMKDGEHWFHTEEQMAFLDRWITSLRSPR